MTTQKMQESLEQSDQEISLKKCANCRYYDHWWGSCFNGDSEHRGDIMDGDDICDCWENTT